LGGPLETEVVENLNTPWLISLGRCARRREAMIRECSKAGFPYHLVEAVDGEKEGDTDYLEKDLEAFAGLYRGRRARPGEIACYASHLMALERISGRDFPYGIVMEDDVKILSDFEEAEETIARQVAEAPGFSVIYPGGPLLPKAHVIAKTGGTESLNRLSTALIGTQCYIISRRFSDFILENWGKFYRPIDEVYRFLSRDGRFEFYHARKEDWWVSPDFNVASEINKPKQP